MARGTIRYWAAARAAAGSAEEPFDGGTVGEVLDKAAAARSADFARVLAHSSLLVDGLRARREQPLDEGSVIEVLPPFAGG
jgi:molybdopterin converting factor small subunit